MTNKINGIDVSKCRRRIGKSNYCRYFKSPCADNSNCIWKKYARLQKENKKLYEKNVQLQKENEELKANKGRCAFKCLDNTFCDDAKIKIDKLELDKDCLNASLETARKYRGIAEADRDKYKQALEEIRELIQKCEIEDISCVQCNERERCHCDLTRLTVDKIDEVLND